MRGQEQNERRQGSEGQGSVRPAAGRGWRNPQAVSAHPRYTETFKGLETAFPILNYGGANKDNRPIELLASLGEFTGVKYKSTIAFWSPAFGRYEPEQTAPTGDPIPQIAVQEYLHIKKHWINVKNETKEKRKAVFCLVYGQLSESSRCEIQDHE